MRILKYISFMIISIFILPLWVQAASGKIAITSSSSAVVGNKITVKLTISSSVGIGGWQMNLKYDKAYLQLTSSTAEEGGTGIAGYSTSDNGVKSKSYTFTFRTLKTGSTNVTVTGYEAYAASDMSEMSLSVTSKNIKIITQEELEASYSKNNDLSSLEVEGAILDPAFSKDILEYSVLVQEDTKEVVINAKASDSKASITGTGKFNVTSGTNDFDIVVRAENGSEKTYKVIVEVKDANPINVEVNKEELTVVKLRENLPNAPLYEEKTINIDGFDIPAYYSEFTKLTLVGLKDKLGNINLYIYNDNKYTLYEEIGFNKITIYPLDPPSSLDGYQKNNITINNIKVNAYYFNKDSKFLILYGINVANGEKGFYLYDKDNQAITKYNDEYIKVLTAKNELYSYIILGFSSILIILIIIIIIICFKKGNKKNKKKKKK